MATSYFLHTSYPIDVKTKTLNSKFKIQVIQKWASQNTTIFQRKFFRISFQTLNFFFTFIKPI